jgi:hypothetical protein
VPFAAMTIRASRPARITSTDCTGVAKSVTSRRFMSASGRVVSAKVSRMRPPSLRTSTGVPTSERFTTTRPAPLSLRRKSTDWMPRAADGAAAAALAGAAAKVVPEAPEPGPASVTNTLFPATRVS